MGKYYIKYYLRQIEVLTLNPYFDQGIYKNSIGWFFWIPLKIKQAKPFNPILKHQTDRPFKGNKSLQLRITWYWSFLKRFETHFVKSGLCQEALFSAEQVRMATPAVNKDEDSFTYLSLGIHDNNFFE